MKRSCFGTFWFMLGIILYGTLTISTARGATECQSVALWANAALTALFAALLSVMLFKPLEGRAVRLVPLAVVFAITAYLFAASGAMARDVRTCLLARGMPEMLLDYIAGSRGGVTPDQLASMLAAASQKHSNLVSLYAFYACRPEMLAAKQLLPVFFTIGTWLPHTSVVSGWLTPFHVPKVEEVIVNSYYHQSTC